MKHKILQVATLIFSLTTGFMILLPDFSNGLDFYLAQISCYYSILTYLLIISNYSDPKFYPKPIYYCKFPLKYFDFLKISALQLLRKKMAIPALVLPFLYIYWIVAIPNLAAYSVAMAIICYMELLLLSFILPYLIFRLEKITTTRIVELILIYCLCFFYVAQNVRSIWPILLNPVGNFLYLPIFIFNEGKIFLIGGVMASASVTLAIIYTMSRRIRKWEI